MFSVARRMDRHYGTDEWMVSLQETPIVAVSSTVVAYTDVQFYPIGQAINQYPSMYLNTSEVWPNYIDWIS